MCWVTRPVTMMSAGGDVGVGVDVRVGVAVAVGVGVSVGVAVAVLMPGSLVRATLVMVVVATVVAAGNTTSKAWSFR